MKKILTFALTIILIFTLAFAVSAEEAIEESTQDINQEVTVTEEEKSGIIKTLMNSSVWASVSSMLVMAIGVIAFVGKHFKGLTTIVQGKVDTSTLKAEIAEKTAETSKLMQAEISELKEQLKTMQGNEKMFTTAVTLFIMNAKFDSTAKAKITELLTGFVDVANLSVAEICENVNKAIEEAKKAEDKPDTPELDAIINEVTEMALA